MKAAKTKQNSLQKLADYGQSPWLDYIRRNLITSGELKRLIDEEGLKGVTLNPAIFEKALSAGNDYDDFIRANAATAKNAIALYERIAIRDIQEAADILKSVYDATHRRDGYISLEIAPTLASDPRLQIFRQIVFEPVQTHFLFSPIAFSTAAIILSNGSTNKGTASINNLSVAFFNEIPAFSKSASVFSAASVSSVKLPRNFPCWRKAFHISGGIVFTVSAPISSSTYKTSLYSLFFVPVEAHKILCVRAPFFASFSHRSPEKTFS